jgi:hypothetical protein
MIAESRMTAEHRIGVASEEEKLAVGGTHRCEMPAGKTPSRHAFRALLQPDQHRKGVKTHDEQVAEGYDELLRPGARDLVGPEREEVGTPLPRMGKRGPYAARAVDRVGIGEEQVGAAGIGCTGKLMACPVLADPSGRQFLPAEQAQSTSRFVAETERERDFPGCIG